MNKCHHVLVTSSQKLNVNLETHIQRSKAGRKYSPWKQIKYYVQQGSIIAPKFFSINLCNLIFIMKNVCLVSLAAYNTPFMSANSMSNLIENFEDSACFIF